MPALDQSSEVLREEILADARRESEEIVRQAQQEADALLEQSAAEINRARQERLEQARAEAARRRELILATVVVEVGRLRAARLEELLQSIHREVHQRLATREAFGYREGIIALSLEALNQMHGRSFVIKIPKADSAEFSDEFTRELSQRGGRSMNVVVVGDADLTEQGVIVENTEGTQLWDNRFVARLERLWPELRRQVAVQTGLVGRSGAPGGDA